MNVVHWMLPCSLYLKMFSVLLYESKETHQFHYIILSYDRKSLPL